MLMRRVLLHHSLMHTVDWGRAELVLSARGCSAFAKMLSKQTEDRLCLGDIVDDCNLVQNNTERDEADLEELPDSEAEDDRNEDE